MIINVRTNVGIKFLSSTFKIYFPNKLIFGKTKDSVPLVKTFKHKFTILVDPFY